MALYRQGRREAMPESLMVEKKEQVHKKPPLSVGRIAGEILAGMGTGVAVAPLVHIACAVYLKQRYNIVGGVKLFALCTIVFPPFYGLASAAGVYLVGSIGKQTGSFLWTTGCGFLGGSFMLAMLLLVYYLSADGDSHDVRMVAVFLKFVPLILLVPPVVGTYGFNLTRRYKDPKADMDRKSNNQEGQANSELPGGEI